MKRRVKQTRPDDWDSDIDGPWEDEGEPEKLAEDEPLFIGSEMSDSQPVAPTRGRGRAAAATTKTTRKTAAPKKAARPNKKVAAARGRGKKVVESEEEDEEEINEEEDMAVSDVMDASSDMDVDEEEEIVPVKKTYVLQFLERRCILVTGYGRRGGAPAPKRKQKTPPPPKVPTKRAPAKAKTNPKVQSRLPFNESQSQATQNRGRRLPFASQATQATQATSRVTTRETTKKKPVVIVGCSNSLLMKYPI